MERSQLKTYDLPDHPGVYIFKKGRQILYIGKAASLRDRVRSYFSPDLIKGRGERIVSMVALADKLDWRETGSVLEALILEANLIKSEQPPYNVDEKDNKSWNYVVLTKEDFPQVLLVRGRELYQGWNKADIKHVFGPFPEGGALREALKIVRKIFPYRDNKCVPCGSAKNKACRACFNRQIGLCPGVCTGEISKSGYALVIKHITQLFSGNFQGLKRQLAQEMKAAAKAEQFEKARELHRQIEALNHIRDVSLLKEKVISAGGGARIEAFDVAHTAGTETVAVMTVVDNGEPYSGAYRMFKIRSVGNNDVAALTEAIERRLGHPEWPLPRAFAIDGGKAQVNAAQRVLKKAGIGIPVVGVVKDERHRPSHLIGDRRTIEAYERDILLANSEAHRFGITWHRRRSRKRLTLS
ncbi:MAG TPA: UvrB/UvrC motif-containing protein [Candidatus Paceibacterota bacterium]|jgi:excinuclease UvrABC nuclease subunit|nr:UvrB/UvrC motif-containing protein [Candidatus Paceibacterota bacterium]